MRIWASLGRMAGGQACLWSRQLSARLRRALISTLACVLTCTLNGTLADCLVPLAALVEEIRAAPLTRLLR